MMHQTDKQPHHPSRAPDRSSGDTAAPRGGPTIDEQAIDEGRVGQRANRTLPLGSGNAAHPDSFNDTLAPARPSPAPVAGAAPPTGIGTDQTIAVDALPPADPGTLAAVATVQAAGPGEPGWNALESASPTTSLDQTTVLPRVELDGARARVLVDPRLRYEPRGKLGEGGVGEVLSATDHDIGRQVAIKRLRAHVKSPMALARFVEEIRTTGSLEHPNVVPIHDVGVDDNGDYYFVMKHVDGETLETIIDKLRAGDVDYHRRYGFERRVAIFKSVLEAVNLAHEAGIIHRDIKPANVMIGAHGEVLLMDWGLAKSLRDSGPDLAAAGPFSVDEHVDEGAEEPETAGDSGRMFATHAGALLGTPAYMAPEQAEGLPADERSDIYALGVMFHELLTLRHYLSGKQSVAEVLAAVPNEPVPLAAFVKNDHQTAVPADLTHYVKVAVAKPPEERYQTVRQMLDRLDRRAEGDIPVECPMTALKVSSNKFNKLLDSRPFLVLGTLVLGGLGGLSALVYGLARFAG